MNIDRVSPQLAEYIAITSWLSRTSSLTKISAAVAPNLDKGYIIQMKR